MEYPISSLSEWHNHLPKSEPGYRLLLSVTTHMQVYPVHSFGNALEEVLPSYLEMPRAQQTGFSASGVSIEQPFKNVSQGTPRLKIP